ncbi:hypothetical protein NLJ89_g9005 [Agrocybe chaxingu]|uniref:Dicer-like protein 1 n=1 Tax=Agrocybe chaxingu TaxID=84603 RepID=A0A9W8MTZ1_9AGAR|nr:hypothetical protein NLJ89_g9005 [Agrocybe chaxingu]
MESFSSALEEVIPGVTIAQYTEETQSLELSTWVEISRRDLVMVPSRLLLDSLLRGALAITQLHFLIISDAQNIKNQDCHAAVPMVQVMNDFYRVTDALSRPRIFAFASPPPERRSHFDSKMLKLEQALDAKVFGVTEERRAEITALPDRPDEIVIMYDTLRRSSETRLLKQLHQVDPTESVFRRHYLASRYAHDEVGSCASDLVWRRALKEMETGVPWYGDLDEEELDELTEEGIKMRIRKIVKNWAFTMPNLDASSRGFNVSHKFLRLVQVLMTFKSYGEGFRGIIFVQRRAVALVLADLLRTLDDRLGFLRPQSIVGSSYSQDSNYYHEIFQNFATGVCNLLIATKSIEDLDVPKASVVIRYDLFESQVSHAYVRARTRGRESHLIHMIERGNDVHRRILSRITNLDTSMLRWTEALCSSSQGSIPPTSLRETANPYHSDSEVEEEEKNSQPYIQDPTTCGRLYLQDSTTVIYRYAASVHWKVVGIPDGQKLFDFQDIQKEFGVPRAHICSIHLPGSPIHGISGDLLPSKAQARRSACFKACEILYKSGSLDCRLVPIPSTLRAQHAYERNRSPDKDILPDVKSAGTRSYPRKQPNFWLGVARGLPTTLYPTVVYINDSTEGLEKFAPIAILTRDPLPDLLLFRLFYSGLAIRARFQKAAPLSLSEERMKNIHSYTSRTCRAIMNKALVCALEDMTYFFLPLPADWRPPEDSGLYVSNISDAIPWNLVELAARHWAVPIKHDSPEELEADLQDAIVQDRWIEFTRRYRSVRIRRDLTPMSKPLDSPREARYLSLFDFCKAKRKNLEELKNYSQAIIEVSKVSAVLNHLNPTAKPPSNSTKSPAKYLIPELCCKFTLPASTLRTALLLPSIMRRLDDLLLVKELNAKFFDNAVREDLLHNAICTPSAGLEYDYERLELLGDAFLKYLSSVYVFVTNPSLNEGSLHVARQKIISNRSLLFHSTRVGLPAYIQSKVFTYKAWQPPNFRVYIPPKVPKNEETKATDQPQANEGDEGTENATFNAETAHDPPLLDVSESLYNEGDEMVIGTPLVIDNVLLSDNPNTPVVQSVDMEDSTAEPGAPDPDGNESSRPISPAPPPFGALDEDKVVSEPKPQETVTKKKPKSKKKKAGAEDQTVQWLGDKAIADVAEAIIGAAYISGGREAALQVTKALTIPLSNIDRWSDFGRKVLTPPPNITAKLRPGSIAAIEDIIGHKFNRPHLLGQAMTHSSIQGYESTSYERLEFIGDAILDFTAVCVWSGLQEYLLFESSQLAYSIQTYANELKERQEKEYALAMQEGRSPGQYWLDLEPPKVHVHNSLQFTLLDHMLQPYQALSDVVESIIGAIYISDNFSPVGAESLFDHVLKPFYDKHITLHTLSHHPTKILFELFQAQGCQHFEIVKDNDETTHRCYVLVHEVILASGEDMTTTSAARQASMLALDALEGDSDFMTRTCDCRTHLTHKKARKRTAFEQALEQALAHGNDGDIEDSIDAAKDPLENLTTKSMGDPVLFFLYSDEGNGEAENEICSNFDAEGEFPVPWESEREMLKTH